MACLVSQPVLLSCLTLIPFVVSWGQLGHQITGKVAQHFLMPTARLHLQTILKECNGQLASVTPWADSVKHTAEYKWSSAFHYVPSEGIPKVCRIYSEELDCHDGNCLIGAITNYTQRASCKSRISDDERATAVKFLIHFLGEVTQPLHVCGRDRGGTETRVYYGKTGRTTLHAVWDTNLVVTRLRENYEGKMNWYAGSLIQNIEHGNYRDEAESWLTPYGLEDKSKYGRLQAAIEWAKDTTHIPCGILWDEYDSNQRKNLRGNYYRNVIPVVDLQLAKAGYRMAHWLNLLFAEQSCELDSRHFLDDVHNPVDDDGFAYPRHRSRTLESSL